MANKGKGKGKGKGKAKGRQGHNRRKSDESSANAGGSTSGSTPTYNFSRETITNILARLPVKSLLRFRCVCKPWRTLIFHQKFAGEKLSRTPPSIIIHALEAQITSVPQTFECPQGPGSIAVMHARSAQVIYIYQVQEGKTLSNLDPVLGFPGSDDARFKSMDVVGCPNGVACIIQQPFANNFFLWNPATRLSKSVSSPSIQIYPMVHQWTSAGLGYDSSTNEFKIIRIISHMHRETHDKAEVYSTKYGRWREVKTQLKFRVSRIKCDAVIRGMPYWRAQRYDEGDEYCRWRWVLLYFDVRKDDFRCETLPWRFIRGETDMCFGEFKRCLGAVVWKMGTNISVDRVFDVWTFDDLLGWSMICRVDPEAVKGNAVGFYGERGIVEEVGEEGNLVMYNLERMEVEDVINLDKVMSGTFNVISYTESLVHKF